MGATARAIDDETHELTGKLGPGGERHAPDWSEWVTEWGDILVRFCKHPDCDVEEHATNFGTAMKPKVGTWDGKQWVAPPAT